MKNVQLALPFSKQVGCENRKVSISTVTHLLKEGQSLNSLKNRFWSKVNIKSIDECWNWTASQWQGYGRFWISGFHMVNAHRVAWILKYGRIPTGLLVCHHCDNPSCMNPSHLFVGTHADNMSDKANKGRAHSLPGEKHPCAKLKTEDILIIRQLYSTGKYTHRQLARLFPVTQTQIYRIINRKRWKVI